MIIEIVKNAEECNIMWDLYDRDRSQLKLLVWIYTPIFCVDIAEFRQSMSIVENSDSSLVIIEERFVDEFLARWLAI